MKFGIAYATHPGIVGNVELAEELGYDSVHLYDSPLVFSELFVVAGMVAARTERIGISISVAVPFLRLPHVLASGVGTLSQAAPGRVSLGFGTGFTAALTTGVSADSWATVRETIRIVRGILADEETEATIKGEQRTIKHLHADLGHINVHDFVPIAISAAGPKGLRVVGEVADGFFTMSAGQRATPATVSPTIDVVQERAAELGRNSLPVTLFTTMAIKDRTSRPTPSGSWASSGRRSASTSTATWASAPRTTGRRRACGRPPSSTTSRSAGTSTATRRGCASTAGTPWLSATKRRTCSRPS